MILLTIQISTGKKDLVYLKKNHPESTMKAKGYGRTLHGRNHTGCTHGFRYTPRLMSSNLLSKSIFLPKV